jgi:hypothetical protein
MFDCYGIVIIRRFCISQPHNAESYVKRRTRIFYNINDDQEMLLLRFIQIY